MCIKDIVIEKDQLCDEYCSKPFTACDLAFDVVLTKPDDAKFGVYLRFINPIKRKTTLQIFILPGPNLEMELSPTLQKVTMKRKSSHSSVIDLPLTKEQASVFYDHRELNLRMGFADVSRGRMLSTFTTVAQPGESTSSDSDVDIDGYSDVDVDPYSSETSSEVDYTDDEDTRILTLE